MVAWSIQSTFTTNKTPLCFTLSWFYWYANRPCARLLDCHQRWTPLTSTSGFLPHTVHPTLIYFTIGRLTSACWVFCVLSSCGIDQFWWYAVLIRLSTNLASVMVRHWRYGRYSLYMWYALKSNIAERLGKILIQTKESWAWLIISMDVAAYCFNHEGF